MRPKINLVYHIHIKLGHINNKCKKNKVELVHGDTWRLMESLGVPIPPTLSMDLSKFKYMQNETFLGGEVVSIIIL